MRSARPWASLVFVVVLGGLASDRLGRLQADPGDAIKLDAVIAGSPKDFLEARHVVLKGSNEAIGKALAQIARDRYHVKPLQSADPLRTRAQRRYVQKNHPVLYERMQGVAAAFGKGVDDDGWNFAELDYGHLSGGCSVIYFPPNITADGHGLVSRDYDFTTGTIRGTRPKPGEQATTSRPYVVEMYPEHGYASLAVYSYDLLSGVLDGMNSEGLTVALLADDELSQKYPMEPAGWDGVGLGVLQTLRMLLDTCGTAEEAKEALLTTKQYYEIIPVHYLVADRHGKAFVWEYSQAHNREYIVENPGKPLVTTNFSLHSYLEGGQPPSAKAAAKVCPRYCVLAERLSSHSGPLTVDFIKATHKLVDATRSSPKDSTWAENRTLWHALYFPEKGSLQISFYLADVPDGDHPGQTRIVRSSYLDFKLDRRQFGQTSASAR